MEEVSLSKDCLAWYFESVKDSSKQKSPKKNIKIVVIFFVLIGAVLVVNGLIRGFDIPYPFFQNSSNENDLASIPRFENPADILILKEGNATQEGILSLMQEVMTSSNIEINDSEEFTYGGCMLDATYHGIIYEKNYYARMESVFKDGSSEEDCKKVNVQAFYAETYFVDGTLYNRQNKNVDFEVMTPGSNSATAHIPFNYNANIFGGLEKFDIVSTSITENDIRVETRIEKTGLLGTYILQLDPATLSLMAVEYEVETVNSSHSRGILTIQWNPEPLSRP